MKFLVFNALEQLAARGPVQGVRTKWYTSVLASKKIASPATRSANVMLCAPRSSVPPLPEAICSESVACVAALVRISVPLE